MESIARVLQAVFIEVSRLKMDGRNPRSVSLGVGQRRGRLVC
jgi:hypothetical protein